MAKRVLKFEEYIKESKNISNDNWFIISYDVIKILERSLPNRIELDDNFRKGILNILIENGAKEIKSIVATTICFSSLQDLEHWENVLNNEAAEYIYFHMGKVMDKNTILISPETNRTFIINFNLSLQSVKQNYEDRQRKHISIKDLYKPN